MALIKRENKLLLIRVLNALLVLFILFAILPLDFRFYASWAVFLFPMAFYMLMVELNERLEQRKCVNPKVLFYGNMALFYVLAAVLISLTGGIYSRYLGVLLLPVILRGLEGVSRIFSEKHAAAKSNKKNNNMSWYRLFGANSSKNESTGLFTRQFFHYKLKKMLTNAHRDERIGLILIELKGYQDFENNWGFCAGNIMIKSISKSLFRFLGENDAAAHYYQGKFAVVTRSGSFFRVIGSAEKLRKKVNTCLQKNMEEDWILPAAIGVAVFPDHAGCSESLLQSAESALQRALITRGERVHVYYSILDRMSGRLNWELERAVRENADSIKARDSYLYGHCERVFVYAQQICRELKMPVKKTRLIELAAFLHDAGKTRLEPLNLDKSLDDNRGHPQEFADILQAKKQMHLIIPSIIHHHERFDGLGYPSGLKGSSIPVGARVIAVADYFDRMTVESPYGMEKPVREAVHILQQYKKTRFDPRIVDAFVSVLDDCEDFFHFLEWPKNIGRVVPSGAVSKNYVLGGHYAEYYSGELHFLIKAAYCLSVGLANNEKCLCLTDKKKGSDLFQQIKSSVFDQVEINKNIKPGQLERISIPDFLHTLDKKKARFVLETQKTLKAWLDHAEKKGYCSVRLIIDHSFLDLAGEELEVWEKTLTRCIKNLDVVIICFYDLEFILSQEKTVITDDLHDRPIFTSTDKVKEEKNARQR